MALRGGCLTDLFGGQSEADRAGVLHRVERRRALLNPVPKAVIEAVVRLSAPRVDLSWSESLGTETNAWPAANLPVMP